MAKGMWKKWLMCGVVSATTVWTGRALTAQEDVLIPGGPIEYTVQPFDARSKRQFDVSVALADDEGKADEAPKGDYWLGIQIAALPEVAKQQLGVEHGLAVEVVLPDSPAAKAEIKKHDILIKAGDTPLKEAADLIKSVDASQGKEITIMIIRGGKDRAIKVMLKP